MLKNVKELEKAGQITREYIKQSETSHKHHIYILHGEQCSQALCGELMAAFEKEAGASGGKVAVSLAQYPVGLEKPLVTAYPGGALYSGVSPKDASDLVKLHSKGSEADNRFVMGSIKNGEKVARIEDLPYYFKDESIALRLYRRINAENILEYIAHDGYTALGKALTMKQEDVIREIKDSGLRGRGGGGFPTGMKWEFAHKAQSDQKYVVCNADEGDPGAFMDRSILESDPHSVIEAMAIAGYAIGANKGFVYVRAEYPVAEAMLYTAINQAREFGFLGSGILGTNFSFDIEIRLGAGAFVCGEETALINSIEGFRGMPRPRPPFPAVKGLWGKPTLINNVETFANIAQIILKGAAWFSSIGTETSKGTKVFALGGKVVNSGLVEIPMGTTLREVIYDICGGVPGGKKFKAVQTGGPSGGCLPEDCLDTPIDFATLAKLGSIMGSGGMVIMDEDNCMVDIAKFFLAFMVHESCGKCPPCRIGTKRMLEILEKISHGKGTMQDIDNLERLSENIQTSSLCALGQTASNPVRSTLRYFRSEYEAHVRERHCPAGACRDLIHFHITEKCIGCEICRKNCPVGAIAGEKKKAHTIDTERCTKCGICLERCPFKAISTK